MSKEYNINNQIEVEQVDVVLPCGTVQNGVLIRDAMEIADGFDLDLVEVSSQKGESLAVCKIVDYGKMKYKENKKAKPQRQTTKEIRFGVAISDHDLGTKNRQVHRFLEKHYLVKYSVELRGRREQGLIGMARTKMLDCLKEFEGKARWSPIKVSSGGRMSRISTLLSPL